jgi:guanylate kinase
MLILTGKSATGKDSIAEELIKLGYSRIITYTTRPMRDGEVDGETYHFISVSEFLKKYIDGEFLEVNYYTTKLGVWFYGSSLADYQKADNNTICVLTPCGIKKLKQNNIKHTSFLINVSDNEILKRQIMRGDNQDEAERRFMADKLDFADIDDLVDCTIQNENKNAFDAAKEIDAIYKYLKESE